MTARGDRCGSANPGCGVEEGLGVRLRSMLLIGLAISCSGPLRPGSGDQGGLEA